MSSEGQSLVELVVVLVVGIVVIGALTFATISSLRGANFAKNQAQATKLAQEGIEGVRTGRDRNVAITGLASVLSWNGTGVSGSAIWDYQLYNDPCTTTTVGSRCFFLIKDNMGTLQFANGSYSSLESLPSTAVETIGIFKRAVVLLDSVANYQTEKTVTVIVGWSDFSGSHQSQVTTLLRKI